MENKKLNTETIYGINPVLESLQSGKRDFQKVLIDRDRKKNDSIKSILSYAKDKNIRVFWEKGSYLKKVANTPNHQGVVGIVSPVKIMDFSSFLDLIFKKSKDPLIAILDGIEDPGNTGSILRSAEVLGINGIIIPKDRAALITPTVIKTSAGAAEHIPIAKVTNLNSTIQTLKKEKFWVVGLEKNDSKFCFEYDYEGPTAVVIGSEGKGIRRLVKENCDHIVSIPMKGNISSLNCAAAAAILFYEISRQRGK